MTLSYCWGTAEFLTLRESCLDDMKEGILWSSLPKTFQDTVTVTMWFKIRYLWIDSLCIIQDSREDWERESKRMKQIYKNSFLTIAATGAVDATGGLFVDRNPDVVRISRVRAQWSRELEGDYLIFNGSLWEFEIMNSPLMDRAWVCQERLLSARVLHFGRSQMFWECQDREACETFPEILPPEIDPTLYDACKRLLMFKGEDSFRSKWAKIVSQYSRGSLTKCSDKCIAFAGIVEEFQAFAQSTYLAGFWRHNLEQQLLWYMLRITPTGRPQSYIAPSWSWLSINGYVSAHGYYENEKVLLEILDVRVTHASDNILGPIKSGYILARGILGPVFLECNDRRKWEIRTIRGRGPYLGGREWCRMFSDENADRTSRDAVYLPVIENTRFHSIKGLVLVPAGEAKNEYRRIGMFVIGGEDNHKRIMEAKSRKGVRRRLPGRTFTLV